MMHGAEHGKFLTWVLWNVISLQIFDVISCWCRITAHCIHFALKCTAWARAVSGSAVVQWQYSAVNIFRQCLCIGKRIGTSIKILPIPMFCRCVKISARYDVRYDYRLRLNNEVILLVSALNISLFFYPDMRNLI